MEAGNLGIAVSFFIREEGRDQKEGPSRGLRPQNAKLGCSSRHGAALASPSWRGAVPGSSWSHWDVGSRVASPPPGCQWSKRPEAGGFLAMGPGVLVKVA